MRTPPHGHRTPNDRVSTEGGQLQNLYRFRTETRDSLLDSWEKLADQDRLWMTYQALLEFHRHRVGVIREEHERPAKILGRFQALVTSLDELVSRGHHPSLDLTAIRQIASDARAEAEKQRKAAKQAAVDPLRDDTLKRLQDIVENSFGERPPDEEVVRLSEVAVARYEKRLPPGYSDQGKADGGSGDFLIWNELVDRAKRERRGVIFITDDVKEDWWLPQPSKTDPVMHPRPELIDEMRHEAGVTYYQYTSERFLEKAEAFLGVEVTQESIEEVREVSEAVRQRERSNTKRNTYATTQIPDSWGGVLVTLLDKYPSEEVWEVAQAMSPVPEYERLAQAGVLLPDGSQAQFEETIRRFEKQASESRGSVEPW